MFDPNAPENADLPIGKGPPRRDYSKLPKGKLYDRRGKKNPMYGRKNPNAGRPKGSPNKKSRLLKLELESEHNFDTIKETLRFYKKHKKLFDKLMDKAINGIPLGEEDTRIFEHSSSKMYSVLAKLIGHTYPLLKAIDVGSTTGEKVQLNFEIPKPAKLPNQPLQDSNGQPANVVIDIPTGTEGQVVSINPEKE